VCKLHIIKLKGKIEVIELILHVIILSCHVNPQQFTRLRMLGTTMGLIKESCACLL